MPNRTSIQAGISRSITQGGTGFLALFSLPRGVSHTLKGVVAVPLNPPWIIAVSPRNRRHNPEVWFCEQ
jgi:hypothetical protein